MKLTSDLLGVMTDEELSSRMTALSYIRSARVARDLDAYDIENDLCWIEREQQIRENRAQHHANYLNKIQMINNIDV